MEKDKLNAKCKLLIIGGSAGSLEVLIAVLPKLEIPSFAIVLVLHRRSGEDGMLEDLIAIKTKIPVKELEDKVPMLPGNIYIAPADYHVLFEKNGLLSLDTSEKIHFSRPSIDVSFESAADVYGKEVTAILLSGANADGTNGIKAIQESGGITVIQKPESAEVPYMPEHALQEIKPDFILDSQELVSFINSFA
ncbi:chemotaxis protein CheB [Flavobacterium sp. D11R37]|uniref:chemotaxis protein CheB n=1 Tax=Flavobacterium coralii TaxID=2838017 RepID=UPI001CA72160|nr:chemotaxis protein CheB [Flavobacterium coralii]MBY8961615.1 chemotaxis protein CheB [Flavobacterium coralii]